MIFVDNSNEQQTYSEKQKVMRFMIDLYNTTDVNWWEL